MAIPAWTVSQCDGGHGVEAGGEQLLLPSAAERRYLFGALPQGIPESFSLSCPECGRSDALQAVRFSSISPLRNHWICREDKSGRQRVRNTLCSTEFGAKGPKPRTDILGEQFGSSIAAKI
jgi:hypothetical protein